MKAERLPGLDFTEEMISKAQANLAKTGFTNMEFVLGDIENMPLPENAFDVVISNCVLNLVPDKQQAFFRNIPRIETGRAFLHFGCGTCRRFAGKDKTGSRNVCRAVWPGASQEHDYLQIIQNIGFTNLQIHKRRAITVPDDVLHKYLSVEEVAELKTKGAGIFSLTLSATK